MKMYLNNRSEELEKHLQYLRGCEVMPFDCADLVEKISTIECNSAMNFKNIDFKFLFDYNIFPKNIMSYLTEWKFENRNIQVGDTIVQQAFLPPFKYLSVKMIFGVRINRIISEESKMGFSYETLVGHVEKGESTFTLERTASGTTIFKIQTFSEPGNVLSKLVGPIFSIPYQKYCTQKALLNVKQQLQEQWRAAHNKAFAASGG